jgi:alpha-tubulin suppressor-like RCC1 family protein
MALVVNTTNVVNSDGSFTLGTSTPASPVTGMIRYNSGTAVFEVYNGTAWVNVITEIPSVAAWAWGSNGNGRLGDNTTVSKSSPVSVVGGFTDWVQIAAGANHTAAIRANGTAWSWGSNGAGRLGDNTTVDKSSPVSVVGGFTDWVQISAGNDHTVAIRANGTAWAWGGGSNGQLGDNTTVNKSSPVSVVGGFTDWVQVAICGTSFGNHTVAIRANGTAYCWGSGANGRLGDNTTVNKSSPVSVVGGFTDWVQIAAGGGHTAAIRANGTAYCWGSNGGALGNNSTAVTSSPVSVVGGFTDWVQISAGTFHTAAIRANGTAWSWGNGFNGRLGDFTGVGKSSPVSVVGGFTDWVQISCGNDFSSAIRANGTAWAWGHNGNGRLGDNSTISKLSPVSVVGGFTDWVQISAGANHAAAIRSG